MFLDRDRHKLRDAVYHDERLAAVHFGQRLVGFGEARVSWAYLRATCNLQG